MFRIVAFLLMASMALAGEVRYDLTRFVNEGLAANPQIQELKHGAEAKKNQLGKLKSEAILPTFYVTMMVGPAPGLKNELQDGDTVEVYDFSRMGPFWGVEAKFIQPLNLGQYRAGKMAPERIRMFNAIGIYFKRKSVSWNEYYELYRQYIKDRKTAEISSYYKCDGGELLGLWVYNQKRAKNQNKLPKDRERKLRRLGVAF